MVCERKNTDDDENSKKFWLKWKWSPIKHYKLYILFCHIDTLHASQMTKKRKMTIEKTATAKQNAWKRIIRWKNAAKTTTRCSVNRDALCSIRQMQHTIKFIQKRQIYQNQNNNKNKVQMSDQIKWAFLYTFFLK